MPGAERFVRRSGAQDRHVWALRKSLVAAVGWGHDVAVPFETPEEAALSGFGDHAKVVLVARDGDQAAVLMLTDGWDGYPYLSTSTRVDNGWEEMSSGNGCSWTSTDEDSDDGFMAWWSEVPPDATAARVRWGGAEYEVPAREGYCLWARANVSDTDSDQFIEVAAIRTGDRWRRVRRDRQGRRLHQRLQQIEADLAGQFDDDELA